MNEEPGEFANAPQSIGEFKSLKEGDMSLWSPRDVLIHVLRLIDTGEIDVKSLVVCMRRSDGEDLFSDHWKSAKDVHQVISLLEVTKARVLANMMGLE